MKKFFKILTKTVKIFFAVLVILYVALFAYVSINKKSIIKEVTAEIGKKINGKVSIEDVELSFFRHFPKISVLLHRVTVTDSLFTQHGHPFFKADKLFAELSITKLIKKQAPLNGLRIEKGTVYLYTDSTGYSNTYLFKQKKDSSVNTSSKERNELKSIILKEVSIIIDDRKREKLHNYFVNDLDLKLDDKDDLDFSFDADADVVIHSMAFNLPRGSFCKEKKFTGKFGMRFNKKENQLQFDSIDIKLDGQAFNLSGRFDLKQEAPQFSLRIHAKDISYNKGKTFLPDRINRSLSIVELDEPLDVDASIDGPLKGGEPKLLVRWVAKNTALKTPFLDFEHASFTGYYSNEVIKGAPRQDSNSVISISNFLGDWHGLPLTSSNIEIMNLEIPVLSCDLVSNFPLIKLNELLGSSVLSLQSGTCAINITYKGPIEKNNNTNSFINGTVSFKDGNLLYAPRNVEMKNVNGQMTFKNSDVLIENLQCAVLNNKIIMQGKAKNLLTLINTEPGKAIIDWNIYSPSLNLGSFIYLLKTGNKSVVSTHKKSSIVSASTRIDDVLEKASFHVNLDAARFFYKKFEASTVNADISLLEDKYIINNVSMKHAGGNIEMNGSILRQKSNYVQTALKASLKNVNVTKLFNAFDNFGQTGITAENLEGLLKADLNVSVAMDENGKVYPSSLQGLIDFSLKDGALNNYEPVKKIQKIIFKKRDFDNIRFAELKDKLEINNGDIKINRMEIQSSVLSFFVEGTFSTKTNTDISIQVPLNNLKKRKADYNPENIGTDKKGGTSIYLRGRPGADGNVNFKIDLLNKFKKEKNRSDSTKL